MKKLRGIAAIAFGASVIPVGILATGIAAADDYAGQTYADASSALSDAGMKGVIATRSGDSLPDDQCVVEKSEKAAWLKGDDFAPVSDTVLLHLNCNAGVATAAKPGNSAASPEGRAAIQQAKQDAADQAKSKP